MEWWAQSVDLGSANWRTWGFSPLSIRPLTGRWTFDLLIASLMPNLLHHYTTQKWRTSHTKSRCALIVISNPVMVGPGSLSHASPAEQGHQSITDGTCPAVWAGDANDCPQKEQTDTRLTISLGQQACTRKVKPIWILRRQEMVGWQWHQLDHMQIICTSL